MREWSYYNENDSFAAAWLRELIKENLIAPGEVDERSICDVAPSDLRGFAQVHLFAGIGGWSYALRLAGWPDDRAVWTGSCPCQPFSAAGKQKGTADKRHLWPEMFRLIRECHPDTILGEQVEAAIKAGWLDGVFSDLEGEDYICGAVVLGAHSVRAPHIRQRLWWVADASQQQQHRRRHSGARWRQEPANGRRIGGVADTDTTGRRKQQSSGLLNGEWASHWNDAYRCSTIHCADGKARRVEPGIFPLAYGVPNRVGTLRGAGNAIVPQVAAEFIRAYLSTL